MNSPLPYIGGKSKLSEKIIKMIPEHKAYCEVFAGAAWVFFRKEPWPEESSPRERSFSSPTIDLLN